MYREIPRHSSLLSSQVNTGTQSVPEEKEGNSGGGNRSGNNTLLGGALELRSLTKTVWGLLMGQTVSNYSPPIFSAIA